MIALVLAGQLVEDVVSASVGPAGVLLVLVVWLAAGAFGLRRGSRIAYWLSLAGLPCVLAGSVIGIGGTVSISSENAERVARWMPVAMHVDGIGIVVAVGLAVTTLGLLIMKTSRAFFRPDHHDDG
ncbi:hypothetical protein [Actinoplanes ianthinogenes]|nr:hypothetical protein [Actinoplanes ianthinogenes]